MDEAKLKEGDLQRLIMIELSSAGHFVERIQSGLFYTKDGRLVRVGYPGRSDISGARAGDNRAFFMEVKTAKGRATKEQRRFIDAMKQRGVIAGIVRSVGDAFDLLSSR